MTKVLATPGPAPAPPEVLQQLSRPIGHHRTEDFKSVFSEIRKMLQLVFQTKSECLVHASTGTGAMESLIVNLHSPGDKIVCLSAGKFGHRWVELARAYGLNPIEISALWGKSPDPQELKNILKIHKDIKSVVVQACETSTGQRHPIEDYAKILKSTETLFLVDGITALGAYDLPMAELGIDGLIGGSQKAFMCPTGLSFISLSDKAWKAYEVARLPKYYFDLKPELQAHQQNQTRFSSPVSLLWGLEKSLKLMTDGGVSKYFEAIERRSLFCRDFAQHLGLKLFPDTPSPSLSVILLPEGVAGEALQRDIEEDQDVIFMGGQDELKGRVLRWGHMGYQTKKDQLKIAESLALGLQAKDALRASESSWREFLVQAQTGGKYFG